jgi:hypothetical protein
MQCTWQFFKCLNKLFVILYCKFYVREIKRTLVFCIFLLIKKVFSCIATYFHSHNSLLRKTEELLSLFINMRKVRNEGVKWISQATNKKLKLKSDHQFSSPTSTDCTVILDNSSNFCTSLITVQWMCYRNLKKNTWILIPQFWM